MDSSSQEREIVKKGIERLEKQILQLIGVFISQDQVNIALLKKFKNVDVPAVNSAIVNVQKALQKYVGFSGMDSEYCDRIEELMDKAQAWCLDIEKLYNKAEVHPINASKDEAADVDIFSDNSKVTIFEFLESARWLILDGEIVFRKLIDYTTSTYLMRLHLILSIFLMTTI